MMRAVLILFFLHALIVVHCHQFVIKSQLVNSEMLATNTDVKGGDCAKIKGRKGEYDFETALSLLGFGKFQWMILVISGLIYFIYAYQGTVCSYVGPAAKCDLKMTSQDQGMLNAVFIAGGLITALVWGVLADQYGRRKILIFALLGDGIVTALSSLSQSFTILLLFRFLNGILMVAPGSIILTYLVESIGIKYRASCMVIMGAFCTLDFAILPALSFAVLPIEWKYVSEDSNFVYNSWRILLLVSSIPSFLCGFFILVCGYESPKFLYSQGNTAKAIWVMEKIFHFNYGDSKGPYPVCSIQKDTTGETRRSIILDPDDLLVLHKSNGKSVEVIVKGIWKQTKQMLSPPFFVNSLLANGLMFTCIFSYMGVALWLPEIFNRFDLHSKVSNTSLTFCEITYGMKATVLMENVTNAIEDCTESKMDISVYLNTFIIGLTTVIGNIVLTFFEKWCGCKNLTIITLFVTALCSTGLYFFNTSLAALIAASIFMTFAEAATMVIQSAASDMFPTSIRGLAMCIVWLSGRMGSIMSTMIVGSFIDTLCELPILLIAGSVFLGTMLGFLLPSSKKQKTSN